MSKQISQQLDELFSLKNSGGMRVFLFAKFFPVINMAEVKSIVKSTSEKTA